MGRRTGASMRSMSSGSLSPMQDEEGEQARQASEKHQLMPPDRPKRSTRGRNPLPPTKGPLFPPLPPKPLRAKSSPRHPLAEGGRAPGESEDDGEAEAGPPEQVEADPTPSKQKPSSPKADKPSWSDRSLTPAPPSSDNVEVLVEGSGVNGSARQKGRVSAAGVDIKVERGDEEGEEADGDTPKQPRTTRGRLAPPGSAGTTPTGSATSDRENARTSLGRRRRGEEQLLLDDHLLPVEIRRTGSLSGKRKGPAADAVEKHEIIDGEIGAEEEGEAEDIADDKVEEVPVEEGEGEAEVDERPDNDVLEEDIVDPDEEEQEEGDGEEVTRCVCQLEEGDPLMVACDKCNVWQHGPCVGIWADEEAPDAPRPATEMDEEQGTQHVSILVVHANSSAHFTPPMPDDLKHLHAQIDRYPPSQSKRWSLPTKSKAGASKSRAKEAVSPAGPADSRRLSRRGEPAHPPAPSSQRERSAKAEAPRGRTERRGSSHHRKASIDSRSPVRDSRSPTAMVNGIKDRETRKRSTMNSRDAAFEDAVQAAIEASRREMGDEEDGDEMGDEVDDGVEDKDKEVEKRNKGKRKREEDIDPENPSAPHSSSHPKVKHPNQYTYRPKPASVAPVVPPAPSPARRPAQASTPAPPILPPPALHEHGTRRAGALANGAREAPFIAVSVTHLGWHLPDYLSSFSDIFPSPNPTPLQVRSPRTLPPIPKNHFLNHRYGPFTEDRDEEEGLLLPPDPAEREAVGNKGETHTEPPARMKYPQRRVTTGEMRKRVRHMLDFCGRVEVEEGRRKERKTKLSIPDADVVEEEAEAGEEDVEMGNGDASGSKPPSPPTLHPPPGSSSGSTPTPKPTSTSSGPTAAQLLAELSADLHDFNEIWARGGFAPTAANGGPSTGSSSTSGSGANGNGWSGGYGGYSPVPPGCATFAPAGQGWPTSGLGRDVVGAEEYEREEEGSQAGEGEAEAEPAIDAASIADDPLESRANSPKLPDQEETTMDVPVDVYRQGQVIGVVSTAAEDEAVQRIKENAERSEEREAEADAEAVEKAGPAMEAAVALLQGVGLPSSASPVGESEVERVDGDGDVVMAE